MSTDAPPSKIKIAADPAILWIGDPCFLARRLHNRERWQSFVGRWSACEGPEIAEPFGPGLGLWVSGFDGHGMFDVIVDRDRVGRLLALRITFANDVEADEHWFNEYQDDDLGEEHQS